MLSEGFKHVQSGTVHEAAAGAAVSFDEPLLPEGEMEMADGSSIVYSYDGSFEGSYAVCSKVLKKEVPAEVLLKDALRGALSRKNITTDLHKSDRVLSAVTEKIGVSALNFVRHAFLTCLPQKERYILLFLRKGFRYGASVMDMLTDDVVNTLFKAVRHLKRESHLLKGFIRFSVFNDVLVAEIEPKNCVLPCCHAISANASLRSIF